MSSQSPCKIVWIVRECVQIQHFGRPISQLHALLDVVECPDNRDPDAFEDFAYFDSGVAQAATQNL